MSAHELDESDLIDGVLLQMMRRHCKVVAIGVLAHVVDTPTELIVRGVLATEPRLAGAVGRWLDSLPSDRRLVVPAVVSPRLAGMLRRRGFRKTHWWDAAIGMDVEAWVR